MSVKLDTIIRTVCLVLALVNQGLTIAGKSPLPIEDEQINELISLVFTIAASLWAWWKNNSFTAEAIIADEVMHDLKTGEDFEDEYEYEVKE